MTEPPCDCCKGSNEIRMAIDRCFIDAHLGFRHPIDRDVDRTDGYLGNVGSSVFKAG